MKIESTVLKRLGPVPFWRGEAKCLDTLEGVYRKATEAARRALSENMVQYENPSGAVSKTGKRETS